MRQIREVFRVHKTLYFRKCPALDVNAAINMHIGGRGRNFFILAVSEALNETLARQLHI